MHRILLFSTTSSPVGGVETWLDRCCQYLADQGMDPIVGLARGQTYNDPARFRSFHPQLNTVEIDGRGLNSEGRIRALMRCVRKLRPDVVLPMSLMEANDAAIRCKQSGDDVRLVIHAQGNLPAMLADLKHFRPGIDHVVCPGRLTKNLLTTWGEFEGQRVSHIPNGADSATQKQTISPGPIRLGYIGRFTRGDKRVTDLIQLHRELTDASIDFTLTIVGDGPARDELTDALATHPNVSMPGPMSHDDLYRTIYPNLDALVLCSSSEAFGIVLAEAMMHGVVPVTSQYIGYHSEKLVVHEASGLSFPVGDMKAAAFQIHRLVSNPALLAVLSRQCLQHASENYTWQRSLSSWHQLLQSVCDQAPLQVPISYRACPTNSTGRLDTLGFPGATDLLRRCRRYVFGSAVPDGGEEWPLFRRNHTPSMLAEIDVRCKQLDVSIDQATKLENQTQ